MAMAQQLLYRERQLTHTWGGQPHPRQPTGSAGWRRGAGHARGARLHRGGGYLHRSDAPGVGGAFTGAATTSRRQVGGAAQPQGGATISSASRRTGNGQASASGNLLPRHAHEQRRGSTAQASGGRRQTECAGLSRTAPGGSGRCGPLRRTWVAAPAVCTVAPAVAAAVAHRPRAQPVEVAAEAVWGSAQSSGGRSSGVSGGRSYGGSRGASGGGGSRGGGGGGSRGMSGGGGGGGRGMSGGGAAGAGAAGA